MRSLKRPDYVQDKCKTFLITGPSNMCVRTCRILVRQMQLVEYAVVTFVRRGRPDTVADRLVLEVALPASAIGQLQVFGLDLGDDSTVCEDWVGSGRQRVVQRMRLTRRTNVTLGIEDDVKLVVDAAGRPKRHAHVDRHHQPDDDQQSHEVQLHR